MPTLDKVRGSGKPALVEFRVVKEDAVYPMVPAGSDLHEMIRRPAEAEEVRS
jgi:acetolactate synthase-1/2/3 large subunit